PESNVLHVNNAQAEVLFLPFTTYHAGDEISRLWMIRQCLQIHLVLLEGTHARLHILISNAQRSEERRVGKEDRARWRRKVSSRRRHTISKRDWSSDVCSSDLPESNVLHVNNAQAEVLFLPFTTYHAGDEISRLWMIRQCLQIHLVLLEGTHARLHILISNAQAVSWG